MKSFLPLLFCVAFFPCNTRAQNDIPNKGFETWVNQGSYDDPQSWGTLNSQTSSLGIKTVVKATAADVHSGTLAIKLITKFIGFPINQTAPGIAATGTINAQTQNIDGGVVFNLRPDSIVGWYKYTPAGTDTASLEITLSKWNTTTNQRDVVGSTKFIKTTTVSSYTRFAQKITYSLTINPDTMVIILLASSGSAPQTNSTLILDDLDLTYTNPPLTATVTSTNVACNGVCNGNATVSASGGGTPYTYAWSNGQTTSTATGLCAATYTVTVSGGGASTTLTGAITQPTALIASATSSTAACGGSNGSASVTSNGGTSPYTYYWSNGQSTATATGLAAGSYTVTVTDSKSCTKTATTTVGNIQGPVATASSTNASCGGSNGTATVTAAGGTPPYSYLWSGGQTTQSVSGLPTGIYTVTVSDFNGCKSTAAATVGNTGAPTVSATSTNASSQTSSNGTATVTASGGTTPYSYLWNNGKTTSTVTGLLPGNYSVVVTGNNGCSATATVTVNFSVGISENNPGSVVVIYPNPASGSLFISASSSNFTITVLDATGRQIAKYENLASPYQLEVSKFPDGVYFYEIRSKKRDETSRGKFVITK